MVPGPECLSHFHRSSFYRVLHQQPHRRPLPQEFPESAVNRRQQIRRETWGNARIPTASAASAWPESDRTPRSSSLSAWTLQELWFNMISDPQGNPPHMSKKKSWLWLVTALAATSQANHASAQLSLFQTEMQAQQHCPNDTVVWLDFSKRTYYVKGQRLYAQGRTGIFVCQEAARKSSYRRSLFGRR
jgi:hypothetical protein